MKNNKNRNDDETFGADEVLKTAQEDKIQENVSMEPAKSEEVVDLKPLKLYKTYELNEEGLRLYGKYKKQQYLNILKWSFLGTAFGCVFAAVIDVTFKRMKYKSKDYLKALFLVGSIGLFTFYGVQASILIFRQRQRELTRLYGKEIEDTERELK